MDNLMEVLAPKTYNKVSYLVVFVWILIGVFFFGIFADTESGEFRFGFGCYVAKIENIYLVREKCFELYEKQYTKYGLPIYGFVLLNFFLTASVCAIYSLIVSPTVDKLLPGARYGDVRQLFDQENALSSGGKLFIAYRFQLFMRFVLGVIFMVLQTQVLYPLDFTSSFSCYLTPGGNQPRNSTGIMQNSTSILHECHNQRATKKNFWMKALLVVNGIFVFILVMETVYVSIRALKDDDFKKNSKFLKAHLNPFRSNLQNAPFSTECTLEHMTTETEHLLKVSPQEFIENTKKIIKEDTCRPPQLRSPFSSTPGEGHPAKHVTLDQIYTNLVVVQDIVSYNFTGDRREKLKVYARSGERSTTPRGPEDIFNHQNKNVLIVGRPGIGKTLWCTKVLRDWAFNEVFHKSTDAKIYFDFAFFIKFKAFNIAADLSLKELLALSEYSPSDHMDEEVWNYILENPERVLIIFDGVDEFKHNSKIHEENYDPQFRNHVDDKMPLFALYEKLATGKLLEGAAVLTTTRPRALSCIKSIPFDKVFEILGFSTEQVKECVTKFAEDENVGEILWRHIGGSMNILSLCYIPASCFIICSSLFQILSFRASKSLSLPTKLTLIYKTAVKMFYLRHSDEFRGKSLPREDLESDVLPREVENKFENLGKIAFDGINEGRLIFGGKEVGEMEDSPFFHRLPDRRTEELCREKQFCFIHLTIQEFFAARHLANMSETELRNFVSENIEDRKWQLVFRFLAGLLKDQEKLAGEIITDLLPVETEEKEGELYNEE